jgi:2-polyprenyl-6-methoxyphenol hydroxylase-like FAD-dependent oxidoreductase
MAAQQQRPRVLVIGAGFAGVALAVALEARGGLDVTLVDR